MFDFHAAWLAAEARLSAALAQEEAAHVAFLDRRAPRAARAAWDTAQWEVAIAAAEEEAAWVAYQAA